MSVYINIAEDSILLIQPYLSRVYPDDKVELIPYFLKHYPAAASTTARVVTFTIRLTVADGVRI